MMIYFQQAYFTFQIDQKYMVSQCIALIKHCKKVSNEVDFGVVKLNRLMSSNAFSVLCNFQLPLLSHYSSVFIFLLFF